MWEGKRKSCWWKENPIVWFWSMCKCVFMCVYVSREHDYDLQQLLLSLPSGCCSILYHFYYIPCLSTGQMQTDRHKTGQGFCIYPFVLCSGWLILTAAPALNHKITSKRTNAVCMSLMNRVYHVNLHSTPVIDIFLLDCVRHGSRQRLWSCDQRSSSALFVPTLWSSSIFIASPRWWQRQNKLT